MLRFSAILFIISALLAYTWFVLLSRTSFDNTILAGTEAYNKIHDQYQHLEQLFDRFKTGVESADRVTYPSETDSQPTTSGTTSDRSLLTPDNIIYFTNKERLKLGLSPVNWNAKLTAAASAKSTDMFRNNYFAHTSPKNEDKNFGYFIKQQKYSYVRVSENLAMGGFDTAEEVVTAWMKSPGHRTNIVFSDYRDIGVSVQKGRIDGQEVIVIVQHFGLSRASCPDIEAQEAILKSIEKQADTFKKTAEDLGKQITDQKDNLTEDQMDTLVVLYNTAIKNYNAIAEKFTTLVAQYNTTIATYDSCIRKLSQE